MALIYTSLMSGGVSWIGIILIVLALCIVACWLVCRLRQGRALRSQLLEAYNEQEILVKQQQVLLAEVDRLYREQAQAAITDNATSLPNHRAIMNRIDEEVAHCQHTGNSCAVLFVDVDHFKSINDTWGHRAGDTILREVGARLRNSLRADDFIGRYGGEEFAVILKDADISVASQVAERLRLVVANVPCTWETEDCQQRVQVSTTVSIGVAVYQLHGVTAEALIESADQAMYRAKQIGRNCICIAELEDTAPQAVVPLHDMSDLGPQIEAGVINALFATASAHDPDTGTHALRMVQLAEDTARLLNWQEGDMYLIRLAALLHDLGKVGVPDTILHKPGPLTGEEWDIMRRHPQISSEILQQVGGIFNHLAHIVASHHERWDGLGYPAGLAHDNIPLSARIISVVDSYDAMISQRPYRQPLPPDQARLELLRASGTQHDPRVVEAFLQVLHECEPKPLAMKPESALRTYS